MSKTSAQRVVITGMGCVTPLGLDLPTTWAAACAGQSGVG
ncbi:MAG: beta-ketoacyl synthase N-terminal-like domain-containing protein, partial [bacterium]